MARPVIQASPPPVSSFGTTLPGKALARLSEPGFPIAFRTSEGGIWKGRPVPRGRENSTVSGQCFT